MAAGDKAFWSDVANAIRPPMVRLVQQATQSIPDATLTALTFGAGSEDIETHPGFHDTVSNTSRITPTIPGYYRFTGAYFTGAPTTPVSVDASFRKNGAASIPSGERTNAGATATGALASCIQPMNGSTDYMELMGFQDSSGAVNSNVSARFTSYFECQYLSPL